MNLFTWMLVGHLAGDFLLQSSWMAEKKSVEFLPLLAHCASYTAAVALFTLPVGGISFPAILIVFLGHLIIDDKRMVELWAKHVSRAEGNTWLKVVQDQSWHIIVLALATLV